MNHFYVCFCLIWGIITLFMRHLVPYFIVNKTYFRAPALAHFQQVRNSKEIFFEIHSFFFISSCFLVHRNFNKMVQIFLIQYKT